MTHYFEDCGADIAEDDEFAAEPFGIDCPACQALL